jgi:hypothetical protein
LTKIKFVETQKEVIELNRKFLLTGLTLMAVAMLATPLVSAKPWNYPKNNPKFEQYETTINFDFSNLIAASYAATAGLEEANKVVVVCEEQPLAGYEIRIGEGAGMRTYEFGVDFDYNGVDTITVWDPILPYAFDPTNPLETLFLAGSKFHFRVDYVYDFSAFPGGLEGTITMLALVTGDSLSLVESKPMSITSLEGTGDFKNVQIQATAGGTGHLGVVIG